MRTSAEVLKGPHYFMVLCRYSDPVALERNYPAHVQWVEEYAASGSILLAGGSPDRTSGAILARCSSREALDEILSKDSFSRASIVSFEVVEFIGRRGLAAAALAEITRADQSAT